MKTIFFNSILAAQVSDGVVRIRVGLGQRQQDGSVKDAEAVGELVMPMKTFTDLANASQKIGDELVERGVLSTGDGKPRGAISDAGPKTN